MPPRTLLLAGAVLAGLAVACGAFGAHGLKSRFAADGSLSADDQQQLANWETAARYQMYHALALCGVGTLASARPTGLSSAAGISFFAGTLVFSGCLYALVLSGQRWLGGVVPIGGMLLIVGWLCFAAFASRTLSSPSSSVE